MLAKNKYWIYTSFKVVARNILVLLFFLFHFFLFLSTEKFNNVEFISRKISSSCGIEHFVDLSVRSD